MWVNSNGCIHSTTFICTEHSERLLCYEATALSATRLGFHNVVEHEINHTWYVRSSWQSAHVNRCHNNETEDQANDRYDEKCEKSEATDERDKVICRYEQDDNEGNGTKECSHDQLPVEEYEQQVHLLLNRLLFGEYPSLIL